MRIVINLLLALAILALGYMTYASIKAPISFKNELDARERAVIQKLNKIRNAQQIYRDVTGGQYAHTWDTLKSVLQNDDLMFINIIGDPDDPNFDPKNLVRDTTYKPAIDTIRGMGINLDSLEYVPYGQGATFSIAADTVTYQSTLVNVVEVGVPYKEFMGEFADPAYAKYDKRYDPEKLIKFGDLTKPSTAGSWDR
ncbi:MAG TPA: hypothetical protein VKZ54_11890 [Membranihabitans sp.]|nr:hypothetical protein [Membranihabitans sp.]